MNSVTLKKLQNLSKQINKENPFHIILDEVEYSTSFLYNISRSRDRFILLKNNERIGLMDSVFPYNVFQENYNVFMLDYSTTDPASEKYNFLKELPVEFSWEKDPYNEKYFYFTSKHIEAIHFFLKHF